MKKALIAFISIWILAVLINQYTGWSVQDLLPPTPVKVRTLTPQEEASFPPPVKIEDKFYRFSSRHPDVWSKPLYADKLIGTAVTTSYYPILETCLGSRTTSKPISAKFIHSVPA